MLSGAARSVDPSPLDIEIADIVPWAGTRRALERQTSGAHIFSVAQQHSYWSKS